jgi:hypothetical protein
VCYIHAHHTLTYIVPYECMCASIMCLRIKLLGICIVDLTWTYVAKVRQYYRSPNKISNLPRSCIYPDNISIIITSMFRLHFSLKATRASARFQKKKSKVRISYLFWLHQVPATCLNGTSGAPHDKDLPS